MITLNILCHYVRLWFIGTWGTFEEGTPISASNRHISRYREGTWRVQNKLAMYVYAMDVLKVVFEYSKPIPD